MEFSRADASAIDSTALEQALGHFGVGRDAWLAKGTETDVYLLDDERVLKLYADPNRIDKLELLQRFYESLDRRELGFALPSILEIELVHGLLAVTERRLDGKPMTELLPVLDAGAATSMRSRYVEGVSALARVRSSLPVTHYLLFDDTDASSVRGQSFDAYVYRAAELKIERLCGTLEADVADLRGKRARLRELWLGRRDEPAYSIVHGDFCPGNVLVDAAGDITGIVDFGSFTMFGDPLYDLALACIFFDMYGPERDAVRETLIDAALAKVGAAAEVRLYRYAMAYAFMSCDLYAGAGALRDDDHYEWAVDLLNTEHYWRRMT